MKKSTVRMLCLFLALFMTSCDNGQTVVTGGGDSDTAPADTAITSPVTNPPETTISKTTVSETTISKTTVSEIDTSVDYDDSHVWIFSDPEDAARWSASGATASVEYGALSIMPTTHDPLISIDFLQEEQFEASEYKFLAYRYKAKCTLKQGVLFPASTNNPSYSDAGLIFFTVRNNEQWQVLIQDMSKSAFWCDTVTKFRIDPINGGSLDEDSQILVERIGFFKTREEAQKFAKDVSDTDNYSVSATFKGVCHSAVIPADTVGFGYSKADYLIGGMTAPAEVGGADNVPFITCSAGAETKPVVISYINSVGYAFYAAGQPGKYGVASVSIPVTNSVYGDNMRFLRARGVFSSVSESDSLTRDEFASLLSAFEFELPEVTGDGYSDESGDIYKWIKKYNLMPFIKDAFDKTAAVSSHDLCEALYAYAKYADYNIFTDSGRTVSASQAVKFCYAAGILTDSADAALNVGEASGIIVRFIKACLGVPVLISNVKDGGITIGAWYSQSGEITENDVKTISDAGINLLVGIGAFEGSSYCRTLLHLANKYGIKVLLHNYSPEKFNKSSPDSPVPVCGEFYDFASFYGNHIFDEPGSDSFDMISELSDYYEDILPGKVAFFNLLPLYANAAQLKYGAGAADIEYYDADPALYEKYVKSYAEKIKSDFICVDVYPNRTAEGRKATYADYCKNMDIFASVCREYDRDFWLYIQTTGLDGVRKPDYNDLRWQAYVGISFGASTLIHFTYNTYTSHGWTESMLGTDKKPTDVYYAAQKVDGEMKALSDIYSQYKNLGCFSVKDNSTSEYLKFDNQYENFTALKSMDSSGPLLVGCFENNGKYAFSAVNMIDLYRNKSNTVTFSVADGKAVTAYVKGVPTVLTPDNGVYTITLECAEGVFVTIE